MSTTDGTRLDAIDRRGRAAARTLLDDLAAWGADTLVAEDAPPATEPLARRPSRCAVPLDRPAVRGGRRVRRRRLLAAAVVAVLVAVAGAVTAATRDDGRPDVSSGGQPDYLLPGWLPGLRAARRVGIPDTAATGFGVDIAVYGDPDTDDPWSATPRGRPPRRRRGAAGRPAGPTARRSPSPVTTRGCAADRGVRRPQAPARGGRSSGRSTTAACSSSGSLTRDEVLAAAEAATTEPAIDASGLPDGYEELARGPFVDSLLFTSLFEAAVEESVGDDTGLAVTYADPADTDSVRPAVVVAQRPRPGIGRRPAAAVVPRRGRDHRAGAATR